MKIMVMSDEESKHIWEYYQPGMFKGIDLILSAGDLKAEYLSFVETFSNVPLLYVHGNHDEKYDVSPPEGCECIEDQIAVYNGIRILGLGGSMRYRRGTHQYDEKDMQRRIRRLKLRLKRTGGFDILVTHAPMADFHDAPDLCHNGFRAFRELLEQYRPKYFVHGHVHMNYGIKTPRLSLYQDTVVINAYRTYTFEYDDPAVRKEAEKFTE
ncbi:MAG: metallophosphoesterase [Oscillospiraceae bacterium]|nr:metallophosphoesterase [Oscillospiraceae bacterium]